jgi:hypothetical protein
MPDVTPLSGVGDSALKRKAMELIDLTHELDEALPPSKKPRPDAEVSFVCRLDLIGSREVRVVSSQPPEGYRYSELFHSNYRNDIIHLLGPYPHLQDMVNIDVQYRTEFVGVLWQKWTDKYVLEKEMDMDVWAQLGKCVIRPEATID